MILKDFSSSAEVLNFFSAKDPLQDREYTGTPRMSLGIISRCLFEKCIRKILDMEPETRAHLVGAKSLRVIDSLH